MIQSILDAVMVIFTGSRTYSLRLMLLLSIIVIGCMSYARQHTTDLVVTGRSDQVSWGFYISNFAILAGVAATAVPLIIPAYILEHKDIRDVVLMGEGVAVAAVIMTKLFVIADLGHPERIQLMDPLIGRSVCRSRRSVSLHQGEGLQMDRVRSVKGNSDDSGCTEAKATMIYTDAYNQSDFAMERYDLVMPLENYEQVIDPATTLVLTTDSKVYQLLNGVEQGVATSTQ